MSLNAKKVKPVSNKPKQPNIESGTYPARLVQLIDLGVQAQQPYQGKEKPPVHMIYTTYEFCDEFMVDENGDPQEDKPRWLSEKLAFYSLDQDRANSTQRYKALDPSLASDGEWPELVGAPVMLTVGTKVTKTGPNAGREYNVILSSGPCSSKQAAKLPPLVNEPKVFLLDEPDMEVFLSLPEWRQNEIKGNLHYQGSPLQKALEGGSKASGKQAKKEVEEDNSEEDSSDNVW